MKRLLQVLLLACASTALATSSTDVDRVANTVALDLDGVIMNCPAPFQNSGSPARRCVSTDYSTATSRRTLTASELSLYGAWRTTDDPNYVYNWISTSGGSVNIVIVPDHSGRGQALVYLGTPAKTTVNPLQRILRLVPSTRLHGSDVMALQNRLMDVSRTDRGRGGDGWFGPVTEANVIAFQSTNGLKPTGIVDQVTWDRLFSSTAQYFSPDLVKAIAARSKK